MGQALVLLRVSSNLPPHSTRSVPRVLYMLPPFPGFPSLLACKVNETSPIQNASPVLVSYTKFPAREGFNQVDDMVPTPFSLPNPSSSLVSVACI